MKKSIFLSVLIIIFSTYGFAQIKSNYSGEWILDLSKSKIYEGMPFPAITKTVKQTDKEIEILNDAAAAKLITDTPKPFIYTLDWNETLKEFETPAGKVFVSYKSGFNKENNLEFIRKQKKDNQTEETSVTEVWQLIDEGKSLKIKNTFSSARGEQVSEFVFTKDISSVSEAGKKKRKDSNGTINGKALRLITPRYPVEAKQAKAEGTVNVQVMIDEKGNVILAKAISGHSTLLTASEEAARLCKFSATKIEGVPVKVTGIIAYNFTRQ